MPQPYIGDIRPWPHPVPPDGWLSCDGSLLPIAQFETLFILIGTTYGGDGEETFALPDLRGRFPMGRGQGPGLTPREVGAQLGTESETLALAQLPAHAHPVRAQSGPATTASPKNAYFADAPVGTYADAGAPGAQGTFAADTLQEVGGSQAHTNMSPFLVTNFIVAAFGVYPSPP